MNMKSVYTALASLTLLCTPVGAQVVTLSPTPVLQFINANGTPASGGELFTYQAGTTTKLVTYTDATGMTPNTDPIILDTRGDANIWIQPGVSYKYVLAPPGSSDPPTSPIWTVDNISLGSTTVASTTTLQTTSRSSVPSGIVLRIDYAPGNGAPPMWFTSETGTCSSNSRVNDTGSCVDATDGNSWVGSFSSSQADIREFGAIANNTTLNDTPVAAALAFSSVSNICAYVPATPSPFAFGSAITFTSAMNAACLTGSPTLSHGSSGTLQSACNLHFGADTNGIFLNDPKPSIQIRHLSICGHAAESTVSTKTYGIFLQSNRETNISDIYAQDFVVDFGFYDNNAREHLTDLRVNDQALDPNVVNGFPRSCVEMTNGPDGYNAALQFDGLECREQSFGGPLFSYVSDGSTSFVDAAMPPSGIPLYRASGIVVRVGTQPTLQNTHNPISGPVDHCGHNSSDGDYTIWDISNSGGGGSGGTQLFCTITTAAFVTNNPQITVPSTSGYKAGTNILAITTHGLPLHTSVVSIDDSTHLTLSAAPIISDAAIGIEFTQAYIASDGCGGSNCGSNIEIRFNSGSIPANGVRYWPLWYDPTGDAVIDDEGSSDYVTINLEHAGGYSTLFYHTQGNFGGVDLKPTYLEFTNQLADIETPPYGDILTFHYIVNPALPGAFPGAPGGSIAPWYVSASAGPTIITFNNKTYNYNGADSGNDTNPGYISGNWYLAGAPGTQSSSSGVAMGAADTIYCIPLIAGAPFQTHSLGVNVTDGGTAASINLAVYDTDPSTHRPGNLLETTGNLTLTTAQIYQFVANNQFLKSPGAFWECIMGSWSGAPSTIVEQSANAGNPAQFIGSSAWTIGLPDASGNVKDVYGNEQPVGTTYHVSGLFAAGYPTSLSGLTTDVSAGDTPLPLLIWNEQ